MERDLLAREIQNLDYFWAIPSLNVVRANRIYGEKLGWYQYIEQINDLLLPFSGQSNVSLGEEAFAEAVAKWQEKNGFTGRDVDGVIGPNTWRKLSKQLGITSNSATTSPIKSETSRWHNAFPDAQLGKAASSVNGYETYLKMINDINGTKRGDFIYMLGWTLQDDFDLITGYQLGFHTFYDLIRFAAQRGVTIKILIFDNVISGYEVTDPINRLNKITGVEAYKDTTTFSSQATKSRLGEIKKIIATLKIELKLINPIFNLLNPFKGIENKIRNESVGSHHEKVILIKKSETLIGYCGGLDIRKDRITKHKDVFLHDVHARLEGNCVIPLLERFKLRWETYTSNNQKIDIDGIKQSLNLQTPANADVFTQIVGTYNSPYNSLKVRTAQDSYKKIIENAREYIYICDQYLVNTDVAVLLNQILKTKPDFKLLIIVMTDSSLAANDILFPDRKRKDFVDTLRSGLTPAIAQKICLLRLDPAKADSYGKHNYLHAKVIIADDELAMIGSVNVNRRSFMHDTESSVIIFNKEKTPANQRFALLLRQKIWRSFLKYPIADYLIYDWHSFAENAKQISILNQTILSKFEVNDSFYNDLDKKVQRKFTDIKLTSVNPIDIILDNPVPILTGATGTSIAFAQVVPKVIVNKMPLFWDYVIDPKA